jgi:dolichol-phosphate mannosyltransferase
MTTPVPWRMVVVLASYNEARSIVPVLTEVKEASIALALSNVEVEVLLVDDSSDDTADVAGATADQLGLKFDVVRGTSSGLGQAMLLGMREALQREPHSIVTLDADGQHNPLMIPTLHRAFAARDDDMLIGSRWARGGTSPGTSWFRTTGSRLGNRIFRVITGTRGVRDATTSFRVYSPRAVGYLLHSRSERFEGYSFFSTSVALCEAAGLRISEVPITFRPRYSGTSKFNRSEAVRFFTSLPTLREERRKAMNIDSELGYLASDELVLLSKAKRWNRLLLDEILDGVDEGQILTIVEVGCGHGAILTALRSRFPDAHILGLEPDTANFEIATEAHAGDDRILVLNTTLAGYLADHLHAKPHDLVVFLNVLEHIEEDGAELRLAARAVRPRGWVGILVPALPALYGPIDFKSGHFRRYSEKQLVGLIAGAGLELIHIRHIDALGVVPYWINYRLLNKSGISGGGVWAFENVCVPATRVVTRRAKDLPLGKNLVALARRPEALAGSSTVGARHGVGCPR